MKKKMVKRKRKGKKKNWSVQRQWERKGVKLIRKKQILREFFGDIQKWRLEIGKWDLKKEDEKWRIMKNVDGSYKHCLELWERKYT